MNRLALLLLAALTGSQIGPAGTLALGAGEDDTGIVEGRVVDAAGAALTGADVRLTRLDRELGPLSYSSMRATLSRADGTFRFEKVAASSWLIDARDGERYLVAPIRVVITRERVKIAGVDLVLTPAAAIEGIVTDEEGRPLEGVGVAVGDGGLQGKNVTPVPMIDFATGTSMKLPEGASYPRLPLRMSISDAKGRFRLAPILPEIPTSLRVGGLAAYHDATIPGVFAPAGGAAFVEIALKRGAAITGRVLRPDGRPAADTRVSLLLLETQPTHDSWIVLPRTSSTSDAPGESRWLVTGSEGLFRFEGLGAARYLVVAEAQGFARATSSILAVVHDGEVLPLEIDLSEGHSIRGRVLDPDKFGLDAVTIEVVTPLDARSGVEPFLAPLRVTPAADGSFELRLADARNVALHVTCPGLPPLALERIDPTAGSEVVLLRTRHSIKSTREEGVAAGGAPSATPSRW